MTTRTTYPSYKPSGIDWLGDIPSHWNVGNLATGLISVVTGGTPESGNSDFWTDDAKGIPFVSIADMSGTDNVQTTSRHVSPEGAKSKGLRPMPTGTVLYSMYASVGKASFLGVEAVANQAILGLTGHPKILTQKYLFRWLQVWELFIDTLTNASTQSNINLRIVRKLPTIFPPLDEQRAIADYLDRKDVEITRFIASRRRMIALLEEKKQAIINHAVTRGLDPSVPMKDSGVEWLGDIPAHWKLRKLRSLTATITKGTTPMTIGKEFVSEGIRFIKVESISKDMRILHHRCAYIDDDTNQQLKRSQLESGDILVAIAGAIGRVAVAAHADLPANTNQAVGIIRVLETISNKFVAWLLSSDVIQVKLQDSTVQSAQVNLSLTEIGQLQIPVPPIQEQRIISDRIDELAQRDAKLRSRYEREIELMQEYRTRLISDVVTGKVRVK